MHMCHASSFQHKRKQVKHVQPSQQKQSLLLMQFCCVPLTLGRLLLCAAVSYGMPKCCRRFSYLAQRLPALQCWHWGRTVCGRAALPSRARGSGNEGMAEVAQRCNRGCVVDAYIGQTYAMRARPCLLLQMLLHGLAVINASDQGCLAREPPLHSQKQHLPLMPGVSHVVCLAAAHALQLLLQQNFLLSVLLCCGWQAPEQLLAC